MSHIRSYEALRPALVRGCGHLCRIAAPMYGPSGKNVLFEPAHDIPMFAGNVREILQDLSVTDPEEMAGVQILRDAAMHVSDTAGSGASTAILLTNALLDAGERYLTAGCDPQLLRKGAHLACDAAVRAIRNTACPADSDGLLSRTLRTASTDPEVIRILMEAFREVGTEGVIQIEDSQLPSASMESGGIRLDCGYASSAFADDPVHKTVALRRPYILLTDRKIEHLQELQNLLTDVIRQDAELLILAKDYSKEMLSDLLTNIRNNVFRVVAAHAPGHGDDRRRNLEALSLQCNGILIDDLCGWPLEDCGLRQCGRAEAAEIGKESVKLSGCVPEDPDAVRRMQRRLSGALGAGIDPWQAENLQAALSILAGNSVTIKAGGMTEIEMFEQKRSMEHALRTARCARRGGVVPGGGTAYLNAIKSLDELLLSMDARLRPGACCVKEVLSIPAATIADNIGMNGRFIVQAILEKNIPGYGFDAVTRQFCDMNEAGILDPAEGLVCALQTAVSTAMSFLTVSSAVFHTDSRQ